MNQLTRAWVWLKRIGHCRGFGIQSPNDYWLVRCVINEHWPYYQYAELGRGEDWLTRKLGRLYLRLANWRQPATIIDAKASPYWQAGCRRAQVVPAGEHVELMRLPMDGDCLRLMDEVCRRADERSVVVVEHIYRDRAAWQQITADQRVGVTFDLYYCGIVLFDRQRYKKNYIINF